VEECWQDGVAHRRDMYFTSLEPEGLEGKVFTYKDDTNNYKHRNS
jgi:hypothetical protein